MDQKTLVSTIRELDRKVESMESELYAYRQHVTHLSGERFRFLFVVVRRIYQLTDRLKFLTQGISKLLRTLRDLRGGRSILGQGEIVKNLPWPKDIPMVSVIVPAFNYGQYVHEAVQSLIGQTWKDLEVIVIDGGSTDGKTPGIVKSLEKLDERIKTIIQPKRTTVGEDRLTGLGLARGKYVFCMDADDMIDLSYVEKAVFLLETSGFDVVTPQVQLFDSIDENGQLHFTGKERIWRTVGIPLPNIFELNSCSTVAMFRLSFWKDNSIGYSIDRSYYLEDWDFWVRFGAKGARTVLLQECTHFYRIHGSSMTDSIQSTFSDRINVVKEKWRYLSADPKALKPLIQRHLSPVTVVDPLINFSLRQPHRSAHGLNILLCVPWFDRGGSSMLMKEVMSRLAKTGVSFSCLATHLDRSFNLWDGGDLYRTFSNDVTDLGALPANFQDQFFEAYLKSRQPDVIMIVGSTYVYERLELVKKLLPKVKIIDHLYNTEGHIESNRKAREQIDFHIVANRDVKQVLEQAGEQPCKIEIILHGTDVSKFSPSPSTKQKGEVTIGFIGRFSAEKRPEDIVWLLKKHPTVQGIFAGSGSLRPRTIVEVVESGIDTRVEFIVPSDARDFYRAVDLVVIPSKIEGLPLVLLEAMACGVPCLASKVGAIPDVVLDGESGYLFEPGNRVELDAKFTHFLSLSTEQRFALGESARKRIVEHFDISDCAKHYLKVFSRVSGVAVTTRLNLEVNIQPSA